ncbi:MAG: hypothetical protein OXG26_18730, partial [Caldilineaceae bacterium]|nr:hypothetical protein [Caldilineaceae bacterium]
MNTLIGGILRPVVIFLLLALALSACVPAAPSPASGDSGAHSSDVDSVSPVGMHNVVYDSLPDMGGAEVVAVTGN